MTAHRAPAPDRRRPLTTGLLAACALLGLASPVAAWAQGVAPDGRVAAGHVTTAPETSEPLARGGLGGPLVIPSIGVVAPETVTADVVAPVARETQPAQRPQEAPRSPQGSTGSHSALSAAPEDAPAAATGTAETTTPPATTTAPAATTQTTDSSDTDWPWWWPEETTASSSETTETSAETTAVTETSSTTTTETTEPEP